MSQRQAKGLATVIDVLREKYGWKLHHELGRGGFGVVYREEVNGIMRAVKISLDPLDRLTAGLDADQRQQALQREREALELLTQIGNHPHVLTLISWENVLGHLVTVWEYAAEGTLLDQLREHQRQNGPCGLPLDQLMPWMEQAAEGIEFLNSRGIYHRDIKPQNLFLVGGQVKVGDLGFLKLAGASTASQTGVGTFGYLPLEAYPRSANEKGQLHRSIDVYGLAASYVHLRTGQPPFGTTPREIADRQQRGQPCVDGMTAAEAEWVRRALSPHPEQRPRSAKEFVRELANRLALARWAATSAEAVPGRLPQLGDVVVEPLVRTDYTPAELPTLPDKLAKLQGTYLAVVRAIQEVEAETHPILQAARATLQQAEQQWQQLSAELERLPLPAGITPEVRQELYQLLLTGRALPPSGFLKYCPESGRWGFFQWLVQLRGLAEVQRRVEQLRQQYYEAKQNLLAQLRQKQDEVWQRLAAEQQQDLRSLWKQVQRDLGQPPEVLPLEVWVRYGPELHRRYIGWSEEEMLQVAEQLWTPPIQEVRLAGHKYAIESVAVTPDGCYVVSGSSDSTVRVWDWQSGQEVRQLTGHEGAVRSMAVTPDGRYVVSGSDDKTVRVWDWQSGQEVRRLTGHENWVWSVAVTPDGRYVVSGSSDKTVRVWYVGDLYRTAGGQRPVTSGER